MPIQFTGLTGASKSAVVFGQHKIDSAPSVYTSIATERSTNQ